MTDTRTIRNLRDYIIQRLLAGDWRIRESADPQEIAKEEINNMSNWELLDYIDDFMAEQSER